MSPDTGLVKSSYINIVQDLLELGARGRKVHVVKYDDYWCNA